MRSVACCGHRINNNTLWLWYEFFSLDKKTRIDKQIVLVTRWSGDVLDLPQVSLEWVLIGSIQFIMRSVLSFKLKTDLIINWIDPIKTHSSETSGKSTSLVMCILGIRTSRNTQ